MRPRIIHALRNGTGFTCLSPKFCDGHCCQGKGKVYLFLLDIIELIEHFRCSLATLLNDYINIDHEWRLDHFKLVRSPLLILRDKENKKCMFLNNEGLCDIYKSRPIQCQSAPIWSMYVSSWWGWRSLKKNCPAARALPMPSKMIVSDRMYHDKHQMQQIIYQQRFIEKDWRRAMREYRNNYENYLLYILKLMKMSGEA